MGRHPLHSARPHRPASPLDIDVRGAELQDLVDHDYDLRRMKLSDVMRCAYLIRQMGSGAGSMEALAERVVHHLYWSSRGRESGTRDLALVRFFKTHAYGELPEALQREAEATAVAESLAPTTRCLVLLGTAGVHPEWNDPARSRGHRVIPLVSETAVARIPMIAQLVRQFGLDLSDVVSPRPELLVDLDQRRYNAFHIEEAQGSASIPDQVGFVERYGIASVFGFGGMLPTGNLFSVIAFSKAPVCRTTAEAFRIVALKLKATILPFEEVAVFRGDAEGAEVPGGALSSAAAAPAVVQSKLAALEELEGVYDRTVIEQSRQLEALVSEMESANRLLEYQIAQRAEAEVDRASLTNQLVAASRQAGMAEVAVGVLHNVGNVLNSVNVSATLVRDHLRRGKHKALEGVVTALEEHADDLAVFLTNDPRGGLVLPFLRKLSDALAHESETMLEEVRLLTANVEHIKTIVSAQQSYATTVGVTELVVLGDVIEDALRINSSSLRRHDIEVVREIHEVPPMTIDKQKLIEILVNLVRNAKEAVVAGTEDLRRMTVRLVRAGEEQVMIEVADTGIGIDEGDLAKIFTLGFTTKTSGHGLGLHYSANAAVQLGGRLNVVSEGRGRGATFRLELPV